MTPLSVITSIVLVCLVTCSHAQQCNLPSDVARFDCFPETNLTQQACEARNCCYRAALQNSTLTNIGDQNVPVCYFPTDFPTYSVTSNQTTDFGQRFRIVKSQTTYMPHDILDLTVDLIYETQQRLRIKIYDSAYKRYEVPLQVPVVEKKAEMTDYDIVVKSSPFAIVVTRKSTGVTL